MRDFLYPGRREVLAFEIVHQGQADRGGHQSGCGLFRNDGVSRGDLKLESGFRTIKEDLSSHEGNRGMGEVGRRERSS